MQGERVSGLASQDMDRDPIGREFARHADELFRPSLEAGKLCTELAVMHRVLRNYARLSEQGEGGNAVLSHLDNTAPYREILTDGERYLTLAAASRPWDFRSHAWLGMLLREQGRNDDAVVSLKRAAAWFSKGTLPLHYAGELLKEQGCEEEADQCFAAALRGSQSFKPALHQLGLRRWRTAPRVAARLFARALWFSPHWLYGGSYAESLAEAELKVARYGKAPLPHRPRAALDRVEAGNLVGMLHDAAGAVISSPGKPDFARPMLLVENLEGYSIYRYRALYYGIPMSTRGVGPALFRRVRRGGYRRPGRRAYCGASYHLVENAIRGVRPVAAPSLSRPADAAKP